MSKFVLFLFVNRHNKTSFQRSSKNNFEKKLSTPNVNVIISNMEYMFFPIIPNYPKKNYASVSTIVRIT